MRSGAAKMRLTCPNCDAQYEVPDEVIPSEGRDVQCSNCGDTWFQSHVDASDPIEAASEYTLDPSDDDVEVLAEIEEADAVEPPEPVQEEEHQQESAPAQTHLDSSVKDILREEAELEAQIRAEEAGSGIESQPELGLDNISDESERRAQEAQDRMARIRGADAESNAPAEADPITIPDSRRGLLPDIEEINSTLHADGDKPDATTAVSPVSVTAKTKRKSNFTRGFALAIVFATVMAMVYLNAPRIAQSIPQADPALNAYVAGIDKTRLWLDGKIGELVPDSGE
jgi:predicted Zn finger-like uncharacterized protein